MAMSLGTSLKMELVIPCDPLTKNIKHMKTREYIKAEENLKIEQEKRYQRKDKRLQVEQLTLLKDEKKQKGTFSKPKK